MSAALTAPNALALTTTTFSERKTSDRLGLYGGAGIASAPLTSTRQIDVAVVLLAGVQPR